MKTGIYFLILLALCSCAHEEKINVKEDRFELLPEPDKSLRVSSEVNLYLDRLSEEMISSDSIISSKNGKKLIQSGRGILPYLKPLFKDSILTEVYDPESKKKLLRGELAYLIAKKIK